MMVSPGCDARQEGEPKAMQEEHKEEDLGRCQR